MHKTLSNKNLLRYIFTYLSPLEQLKLCLSVNKKFKNIFSFSINILKIVNMIHTIKLGVTDEYANRFFNSSIIEILESKKFSENDIIEGIQIYFKSFFYPSSNDSKVKILIDLHHKDFNILIKILPYLDKEKTIYLLENVGNIKEENLKIFSCIKYISSYNYFNFETEFNFLFAHDIEVYFSYLYLSYDIPKCLIEYFKKFPNHLVELECDTNLQFGELNHVLKSNNISLRKIHYLDLSQANEEVKSEINDLVEKCLNLEYIWIINEKEENFNSIRRRDHNNYCIEHIKHESKLKIIKRFFVDNTIEIGTYAYLQSNCESLQSLVLTLKTDNYLDFVSSLSFSNLKILDLQFANCDFLVRCNETVQYFLNLHNLSSLSIKADSDYNLVADDVCLFVIKGIFKFDAYSFFVFIDDWYRLILHLFENNKNINRYQLVISRLSYIFDDFLNFLKLNGNSDIISRIKEVSCRVYHKKLIRQFDLQELDLLTVYDEYDLRCFNLIKSVKHLSLDSYSADEEIFHFIYDKNVELLICKINEKLLDNFKFFDKIKFIHVQDQILKKSDNDFLEKLKLFVNNAKALQYFALNLSTQSRVKDSALLEELGIKFTQGRKRRRIHFREEF